MRINSLVKTLFAMPLLFTTLFVTSCDKKGDEVVTPPTVGVSKGKVGETTLSFTVTAVDAEKLAYVVFESSETAPEAEAILTDGVALALEQTEPIVVSGLTPETEYCIIAAASNKGGAVKSAPVTMTTLKAQAPVVEITMEIVAGETAEFEAEGGSGTIEYEVVDPAFDASLLRTTCEAEWIKDIKIVAEESKVTYTVEANTKAESRSAKIVLIYNHESISCEATISQKPLVEENKPALSLKSEATMKFAAEGGNGTIKYEIINPAEGTELKATCEAAWVSGINVATKGEIAFAVAANETYEARNAKVKVAYGELSFEVAVEQAAAAKPELTLKSEATANFKAEGGNGEFTYELKNAVEGTTLATDCKAEWISKIAIDEKNSKVTYTVAANEGEAREAKIALTYGDLKVEVTVKQEAFVKEPELAIVGDITVQSYTAEGGNGEFAYTLTNPVEGTTLNVSIENQSNWITINSTENGKVSYTVAANSSEEVRQDFIVLTYGSLSAKMRINQLGAEPEIQEEATKLTFTTAELAKSENGGIFTIKFSTADNATLSIPFNSAEDKYLAAATYKAGVSDNEFVYSNTKVTVGENEYVFNQDGLNTKSNNVVVDLAADNTYTFTFNNLVFGNNEYLATGEWSGKIEGLGIFEEEEEEVFEPTHTAYEWMWGGHSTHSWRKYYTVAGEGFSLQVLFCEDVATESSLVAGKYQWNSTTFMSPEEPELFSTLSFNIDGKPSVAVDSGEAVVKVEGEEYTINLTLDGRDGNTYCIQYVGKLNVKYVAPDDGGDDSGDEGGNDEGGDDSGDEGGNDDGNPNTITLTYFKFEINIGGGMGLKFNASDGKNVSLGIRISSQNSSASRIDAGDYNYVEKYPDDHKFAFTFNNGSNINGVNVVGDSSATMNVVNNNGIYTITIVTMGYTCTYTGTL